MGTRREERTTAVTVGVLYIGATVAGLAVGATGAPDELAELAGSRGPVLLGVLLVAAMAAACLGIAAMLYPLLARDAGSSGRRGLAAWYLGTRVAEATLFLATAALALARLGVSETMAGLPVADAAPYDAVGATLAALADDLTVAGQTIFCVGAAMLSWLLLVSGRVPRWIAVLGLVAAPSMLVGGFLLPFTGDPDSAASTALYAPMAVQELVLAVWLLARGFRPLRQVPAASSDAALSAVIA